MIVHDFHVRDVALYPHKAEAILIVDANAVLPVPVAFERLQMVAGECGQILQSFGFVECRELSLGYSLNASVLSGELVVEELLGFSVPKRANHLYSV